METKTLHFTDLAWVRRRLPERARKLLVSHPGKLFIAGGYVRDIIAGETPHDIDFFCPSADYAKAVVAGQVADLKAANSRNKVIETENAISLAADRQFYQFIHRWTFSNPVDCIASFDFTVACAAVYTKSSDDGKSVKWESACHPDFYADLAAKRLVYTRPSRNEDAGGSILRVLKFYQRGYRIPLDSFAGAIARLVSAVKVPNDGLLNQGGGIQEEWLSKILLGLLREVDPNAGVEHEAYLRADDGAQLELIEEV